MVLNLMKVSVEDLATHFNTIRIEPNIHGWWTLLRNDIEFRFFNWTPSHTCARWVEMWTCSNRSCTCWTGMSWPWCILVSCCCSAWKRGKLLRSWSWLVIVACRDSLTISCHWHRRFVRLTIHSGNSLISSFHLPILIFLFRALMFCTRWVLLHFWQNSIF